jgi:small ligand-binding sensory domain FIST
MQPRAQSISLRGDYDSSKVTAMAADLARNQGSPSRLAFVYVTEEYLPHLDEFCDILRVDGRIVDVVGCTAMEIEEAGRACGQQILRSGCSVLALCAPDAEITIEHVLSAEDAMPDSWSQPGDCPPSLVALFDPTQFPIDLWLQKVNSLPGGVSCVGGFASATNASSMAVFHNGRIIHGGVAVGLRGGGLGVRVLVSQGCRPIGEPLTVTRAENNVIYSLGGQPAYQALETAFETLSNEEKATARGNLFAGLASTEYVDDFDAGDFMVRSIIGADPNSGAVVIAGTPRVGQTMQYQFRDRASSSQDLHQTLGSFHGTTPGRIIGSLLFRCTGRGEDFFGQTCHDIEMIQSLLGKHPATAFACNGEIAPLHSVNSLTTFSAATAIFTSDEA